MGSSTAPTPVPAVVSAARSPTWSSGCWSGPGEMGVLGDASQPARVSRKGRPTPRSRRGLGRPVQPRTSRCTVCGTAYGPVSGAACQMAVKSYDAMTWSEVWCLVTFQCCRHANQPRRIADHPAPGICDPGTKPRPHPPRSPPRACLGGFGRHVRSRGPRGRLLRGGRDQARHHQRERRQLILERVCHRPAGAAGSAGNPPPSGLLDAEQKITRAMNQGLISPAEALQLQTWAKTAYRSRKIADAAMGKR